MRNPKELTRVEVLRAASAFRWSRKLPKWTVIVDNRELPARPLVLDAAGVPPNDPTNSHQAVAILKNLGFETRYAKESREASQIAITEASTTGQGKQINLADTLSEFVKDVPDSDWRKIPTDLSKNLDHYLYGNKKTSE